MGLPPNPRSARPQGGRNRPPALAPRPSLSPSNPRGLGVQPSPNTTTCHPPDPLKPSRKHSPAGRKSAGSSGLASLCPAHAPPLASRASALALSTLFVISVQAPPDFLYKNKPSTEDVLMLRTVKDFFEAFLKTPSLGIFPAGRRFVTAERAEGARQPERPGFRGREELQRQRATRREVRSCAGLVGATASAPRARGRKTAGVAQERGPGTTESALAAPASTRFAFRSFSFLFLYERERIPEQAEGGGAERSVRGISVPTGFS